MSEKSFKPKEIFMPTLVLLVICLITALALGLTNMVTEAPIAAINAENLRTGMREVLPAEEYKAVESYTDAAGEPTVYEASDASGVLAGMVIITTAKGYGGDVKVMTGIADGKISAVKVVDCANETPGLGQNAQKPDFTGQFEGIEGAPELTKGGAGDGQVDALTGATITSKAVTDAVAEAMEIYASMNNG